MNNWTISKWPFDAAIWRGVFSHLSMRLLRSSAKGVYIWSSEVRNSTTAWQPPAQALWSGVFPYSSSHSGSICCSRTRYLTTSRWPCWLAKWRDVNPSGPGDAGLQFLSVTKYLKTCTFPVMAAMWKAVKSYAFRSPCIGLQCISSTRNLTYHNSPVAAAWWSSKPLPDLWNDDASARPCTLSS